MKKILLPLLLLLHCLSCSDGEVHRNAIEKTWISGMKINPETKAYTPNALMVLEKGQGSLSNIGQNSIDFKYKIKDNKINLLKSSQVVGAIDILHHSAHELTLINFQKDTLEMKPVFCAKMQKAKIREALLYKTFRLDIGPAFTPRLLYFHKEEVVSFEEPQAEKSFEKGILAMMPMRFDRKGWELQQYGDFTSIHLKGYEEKLGYPLIGLAEHLDDQLLNIHSYIDKESRLFELSAISEDKQQLQNAIVGTWGGTGSAPLLQVEQDGSFQYRHDGLIIEGKWLCDDSGKIVILEGEQGFLKFCSLSKKGNQILIELSKTVMTSLVKKN